MSFFEFPHTRTYDNDLGWLIYAVNRMKDQLDNFINFNTIKYADPIQWNITTQYESNTVVVDPQTGNAYISVRPVPGGVNISNTDYWTPIFNYYDAINTLRDELTEMIENQRTELVDFIYENTMLHFNTAVEMMESDITKNGSYAVTGGYYQNGDSGACIYKITDTAPSVYYETLTGGLYAVPVYLTDSIDILTWGIKDGDGTAKLQRMINEQHGKKIVSANAISLNVSDYITVTGNSDIDLPNVTFVIVDQSDIFHVVGNDIHISAAGSGEDDYTNAAGGGTFFVLGNCENLKIDHCTGGVFLAFIKAVGANLKNACISNNTVHAHYCDIYADAITGYGLRINDNYFIGTRTYSNPLTCVGGMRLGFGFNRHGLMGSSAEQFNDTLYGNKFQSIEISRNRADEVNARFITVCNGKDVTIADNVVIGKEGVVQTPGVSDDVYVVEYCTNFTISGNYLEHSGQNGIDILASKFGTVTGNTIKGCYTHTIAFDISDCYKLGFASALSMIYEIPQHVTVSGNTFNARAYLLDIRIGQNLTFTGNDLSKYKLPTESTYPGHAYGFEMLQELLSFVAAYKFRNIEFSGNTINDNNPNGVIQNGTSTYFDWSSISLEESMAMESGWINANAATGYSIWSRTATQCGIFQHCKIYFNASEYIGTSGHGFPAGSALEDGAVEITGMYYEGGKRNGARLWAMMSQTTYIELGDYITGIPQHTTGEMTNFGQITQGQIKLKLW